MLWLRNQCWFISFFVIGLFLIGMNTVLGGYMAQGEYEHDTYEHDTVEVVVAAGDTVWSIAKEYQGPEGDIRPLVYEIGRLNELQSPMIYPGQVLLLPKKK
ncbi:MAG: LysM peptidoglycan-binding domain-containing protein [Firmicutes bacterium]|nr:LysM peptidoglycan-binding domain-containing protein [Bacillota bacterium]